MLCYSVKLLPAYSLKKIKSTQCILSFLPGCLRSYLTATAFPSVPQPSFWFPRAEPEALPATEVISPLRLGRGAMILLGTSSHKINSELQISKGNRNS